MGTTEILQKMQVSIHIATQMKTPGKKGSAEKHSNNVQSYLLKHAINSM